MCLPPMVEGQSRVEIRFVEDTCCIGQWLARRNTQLFFVGGNEPPPCSRTHSKGPTLCCSVSSQNLIDETQPAISPRGVGGLTRKEAPHRSYCFVHSSHLRMTRENMASHRRTADRHERSTRGKSRGSLSRQRDFYRSNQPDTPPDCRRKRTGRAGYCDRGSSPPWRMSPSPSRFPLRLTGHTPHISLFSVAADKRGQTQKDAYAKNSGGVMTSFLGGMPMSCCCGSGVFAPIITSLTTKVKVRTWRCSNVRRWTRDRAPKSIGRLQAEKNFENSREVQYLHNLTDLRGNVSQKQKVLATRNRNNTSEANDGKMPLNTRKGQSAARLRTASRCPTHPWLSPRTSCINQSYRVKHYTATTAKRKTAAPVTPPKQHTRPARTGRHKPHNV